VCRLQSTCSIVLNKQLSLTVIACIFSSVVDPHFFHADPDPVFFITMRIQIRIWIQGAKPMRMLREEYRYLQKGIGQKTIHTIYEGTKAFLKGRKPCLFDNFWSASMLLDLDPDPHSQYGFGSRTAK
jgi:hypothetical protein